MITVTFTAPQYSPNKVRRRYVRAEVAFDGYRWCEVGDDKRYDIRQGTCDTADLPDDVRRAADALRGQTFAYVDWPPTIVERARQRAQKLFD